MPEIMLHRSLPGRESKGDSILAFGNGYAQVRHTPGMEWKDLLANCPAGWTPDVYIHWSPEYNAVPKGLELADCLTVGAFGDWNLGGRAIHAVGGMFDVLFADRNGGAVLRQYGFPNVHYSPLWAFDPETHRRMPGVHRDLDIVMVGSFNHAVQWERSRWLARVARLSTRHNVVVTGGVYGEEYVRLMNRAKIVFNRSIRGELNMRTFEATACGALLFYERENPEIRDLFADREECVLYGDDLEVLLAYYLAPENAAERERIAEAGWQRVQAHSNAFHFADFLNQVEPLVEAKREGKLSPRVFCSLTPAEQQMRHGMQWFLSVNRETYPALDAELATLLTGVETPVWAAKPAFAGSQIPDTESAKTSLLGPDDVSEADVQQFRAVLVGETAYRLPPSAERETIFAEAIAHIRTALEAEPDFALARRNLAWLLLGTGKAENREAAEAELRASSRLLETRDLTAGQLRGPCFPRDFDAFNVRMEQVWNEFTPGTEAWREAFRDVLLGQIYGTLATLSFARAEFAEAVRCAERAVALWPGHGEFRAQLARGLRAQGRGAEAVVAYRQAINAAPFLLEAWQECIQLLLDLSRFEEAVALLDDIGTIIKGSPFYGPARPEFDRLRNLARETARQTAAAPKVTRLLAFPNWRDSADWQGVVRAFAEAYPPSEPVLLMLRADPEISPAAQELLPPLQAFLTRNLDLAPSALPHITVLNQPLAAEDHWKLYRLADAVLVTPDSAGFQSELAEAVGVAVVTPESLVERGDKVPVW
jgi:tetratricopeptide (TPR) repeat protein